MGKKRGGNRGYVALLACPAMTQNPGSLLYTFLDRFLPYWSLAKPALLLTKNTYLSLVETGYIQHIERVIGRDICTVEGSYDHGLSAISAQVVEGTVAAVYQFSCPEAYGKCRSENTMLRRQCIIYHTPLLINNAAYTWELYKWITSPRPSAQDHFLTSKDVERYVDCHAAVACQPFLLQNHICALIAHNDMKEDILTLVRRYGRTVNQFGRIVATQSTGTRLRGESVKLDRVDMYKSGPQGGDVQIIGATHGQTGLAIFLQDPNTCHPHQADIDTSIKGICMPQSKVSLFHDAVTAGILLDHMSTYAQGSGRYGVRPILLAEALELLFNVKVVLTDATGPEAWSATVRMAAWHFLKAAMIRQKQDPCVSVCIPRGFLNDVFLKALGECRCEILAYRNKDLRSVCGNDRDLDGFIIGSDTAPFSSKHQTVAI